MHENKVVRLSQYVENLLVTREPADVLEELKPLLSKTPNKKNPYLKDFICCTHMIIASYYLDGVMTKGEESSYWKNVVVSFQYLLESIGEENEDFWAEAFSLVDKYDEEFGGNE